MENNPETFASYVTRVSNTLGSLNMPMFSSKLGFVADNNVKSFNTTFSSLNMYCNIYDLATNSLMETTSVTSGTDVNLTQTNMGKYIELYFRGSGNISAINLNYSLNTDYALGMSYYTGSTMFKNNTILKNIFGINSTSIGAVSNSGARIASYNNGFSYSPNIVPNWIQNGAVALTTGPSIKTSVFIVPDSYKQLPTYLTNNSYINRLPLKTIFTSTTGPQESNPAGLDFDPLCGLS